MKLKRLFAAVLAAVSMLTMGMMLSGCGGSGDSKEDAASASYTTQDEAVQAATKESQEVVKQIEAREGKVVVIWANTAEDASAFTLGLVEKDGESWKVTNTASVTMTDKFSGKGSYPVNDPMITYDVTPEIDDPVAGNHANHEQANDWCIHWTLVPELPA